MNVTVFNVCMVASWASITYGAWLYWGTGVAAMVAGALLGFFTLAGAALAGLRARSEVR